MELPPIDSFESYAALLLGDSEITLRKVENVGGDVFDRLQTFIRLYKQLDTEPAGAALIYQDAGSAGSRYREVGEKLVVGRLPKTDRNPNGADIAIDDAQMSRRHFVIDLSDGFHVLRDLDSRNGTYLNNNAESVREQVLRTGDVIRAGASLFVFTGAVHQDAESLGSD